MPTLSEAVRAIVEASHTDANPKEISRLLRQYGAPDRVPERVLQAVLAVARLLQ